MKRNNKRTTKKKILFSIGISLFVLLANYIIGNTSFPLPNEMEVLKGWDKFQKWIGKDRDSIPNEVLLVNVAFDKQLVDYNEDGMPVGQYAITDRQKLLDFLTIAQQSDSYKYIFLDVIFEQGIESPYDSALFRKIASMPRIVIPVHEDTPLQDSILYVKAANADYTVTCEETNFARFQFIHNGIKSMPLRMYEDISDNSISKWGILYFSHHWLCRNGITLKMPIKMSNLTEETGDMKKCNVLNLGVDLLAMDTIAPIADEIKDKIVIIGNYKDDVHDTYVGLQSGSIICLNAYYALERGDHLIWGNYGVLFFFFLMAIVYFFISIAYLNGFSLSAKTDNPWIKLLLSLVSINVVFWTIAILAYISPLDIVYNVWLPIIVFTLLDFIINIYSSYKEQKDEKTTTITITTTDGTNSECSEEGTHLQGALHEPSPNSD